MRTISILLLILLLTLIGCREPAPDRQATAAPTGTAAPADTAAPAGLLQRSDIRLSYPETIGLDEGPFAVQVSNEGSVTYVYHEPDRPGECLSIDSVEAAPVYTVPHFCDVYAEYRLAPGQAQLYGGWDLQKCADSDCLERQPVEPGLYEFTVTIQVYSEEGSSSSGERFTFEETFTVLPGDG